MQYTLSDLRLFLAIAETGNLKLLSLVLAQRVDVNTCRDTLHRTPLQDLPL